MELWLAPSLSALRKDVKMHLFNLAFILSLVMRFISVSFFKVIIATRLSVTILVINLDEEFNFFLPCLGLHVYVFVAAKVFNLPFSAEDVPQDWRNDLYVAITFFRHQELAFFIYHSCRPLKYVHILLCYSCNDVIALSEAVFSSVQL